jgi:hypothetical protein
VTDKQGVNAESVPEGLSAKPTFSVGAVRIGVWHWYSVDQAVAATTFSRKCGELEAHPHRPSQAEQNVGFKWSEDDRREHRSYVTASILASATFLEASINELYASAEYSYLEVGGKLPEEERIRLTGVADLIANNRFLDKFQITLHLLGREGFDQGAKVYQDAKMLVGLRNELVHYKPQRRWAGDDIEPDKWARGLASKRFSLNPFSNEGGPFFPDRCLSHGCAVWAWKLRWLSQTTSSPDSASSRSTKIKETCSSRNGTLLGYSCDTPDSLPAVRVRRAGED